MRISDWSSDVCSSDLNPHLHETGGEIRIGRIADDEVFKLLLAEPDPLDVVARLNAPSRQLALDIVGRDLPPLRPDNDDEQQDEKQEADQHQLPSRPATTHYFFFLLHRAASAQESRDCCCHKSGNHQIGRASCRERVCPYE